MTPSSHMSSQDDTRNEGVEVNDAVRSAAHVPPREEVQAGKVRKMFDSIAFRYDLANSFLSLGIHKLWRIRLKKHFRDVTSEPVLDVCTGTGDVLFDLERSFKKCIGVDFCLPMMQQGKGRSAKSHFVQGDALHLPFPSDSFGLLTVSFGVRNLESVEAGMEEFLRVLAPGGKLLVLEFGQPNNFLWRMVFDFYSGYVLPFVGGALTGNRAAYEYLPKTSKTFPCGDDFAAILKATNFEQCDWESLTGGIAYLYSARKPS